MRASAGRLSKLYRSDAGEEARREAFTSGDVPVAVYGLGKMGLPVSVVFASITSRVVGVDVDETVVEQVNDGECPIEGEPRLPGLVRAAVDSSTLRASAEPREAADWASVHVLIVPTLVNDDGTVDLSHLKAATRDVGSGLERGDLVVLESTVPPGTSREVLVNILETRSGLDVGEFGLACVPERSKSGTALRDIRAAYPRVVGGIDAESGDVAELVYEEVCSKGVVRVDDVTTAECSKVFEGVYRDVNIALANELAQFADELSIDVNEAIEAANTQPFCDLHDPGIGVGGHCIPYYPYFLINRTGVETPLLRTARRVNEQMPFFALTQLTELLEAEGIDVTNARVLVLGLTYRPGVEETRESPAHPLVEHLNHLGATVIAVDPVLEDTSGFDTIDVTVDDVAALDLDAAVLVTAHEEFDRIDWTVMDDLVVVDGRDALDLAETDHTVYTIGGG